MAYPLQHTAEAIDDKLNLIAANKNLLPYPYDVEFSEYNVLEDVGDGSILVKEKTKTDIELLLNDFTLEAGKSYTISLTITDILENITTISGCELTVKADNTEKTRLSATTGSAALDLSSETGEKAILVYLKIPVGADQGLLIKPQIEEGAEKTTWVPNMDKIGTYVDRRFNGTNVKIKETDKKVTTIIERLAELSEERLQKMIDFVEAYVEVEGLIE